MSIVNTETFEKCTLTYLLSLYCKYIEYVVIL